MLFSMEYQYARIPVVHNKMDTLHPKDIEPFKNILAIAQLRRLLQEDLPKFKETPFYFHHMKAQKKFGLYCRFKKCKARIIYIRNQDKVYEMVDYNNVHKHSLGNQMTKFKVNEDNETDGILYINDNMRVNIERYARCMYINYYTVKENWNCLVFSGVRHDQCICIFGVSVMEQVDDDKIRMLIQEMAKLSEKTETVIVTSEHILAEVKVSFPNAVPIYFEPMNCPRLKVRFNLAKLVLETTTELEWQADKRRMAMELSEDLTIVEIKDYSNKYKHVCLPFLPPTFVGLGVQLMHPLAIFHALEEKAYLFSKFASFYQQIPASIKVHHIDPDAKQWVKSLSHIFKEDSLYRISQEVEEAAFRFLVRQQNRSMYCNFSMNRDGSVEVRHDNWGKFLLRKGQDGKYVCSCGISIKTGLPCCHILKIVLFHQGDMIGYINSHWRIKKREKSKANDRHVRRERRQNRNQIKNEQKEGMSKFELD